MVAPMDCLLALGMVVVRAFVEDAGRYGCDAVAVCETGRYVKLAGRSFCQTDPPRLAECRRPDTYVHARIVDRARYNADKLALAKRVLEVQTAQDTIMGFHKVFLHESRQSFPFPISGSPGLPEGTTIIRMGNGLP